MKANAILASVVFLAAAGAVRADNAERVLVVPFSVLNVPDSQQWIGKGVQENVVAEFGRSGTFSPIAFQGQVIVEDNATAARLARAAQSPLAVRGAAQAVGENIRITAQLIDSQSGDTVRTASVTGSAHDLLKMEDELSAQLLGQTTAPAGAPAATAPISTAPASTAPAAPAVAPAPQIIVIAPQQAPYSNYGYSPYPDYANYYPYSSYGYGYGLWYGTLFPYVFTINVNHDHDHNHVDHHGGGGTVGGGGIGGIGGSASPGVQVVTPQVRPAISPASMGGAIPTASHGGMVPAISPAASHGGGFRGGH